MKGFKMLRKKEREEVFSQICKDVKTEKLDATEVLELMRFKLPESERIIFDEILRAIKDRDIQFSLTGAGISEDYKKVLIKGELLVDIETADKISKM